LTRKVNKYTIGTMMNNTFNHYCKQQQPTLGMPTLWSTIAINKSDRSSEGFGIGVREGDGYC